MRRLLRVTQEEIICSSKNTIKFRIKREAGRSQPDSENTCSLYSNFISIIIVAVPADPPVVFGVYCASRAPIIAAGCGWQRGQFLEIGRHGVTTAGETLVECKNKIKY